MDQKLKVVLAAMCVVLSVQFLSNAAFGQELPDGKGKTEFVDNCTDCHRADMVTRVRKTPAEWRKSVDEMAARGSQGTKQDLDNVVLYLDTYFSTDKPAPAAATQSATPSSTSDTDRAKRVIAENGCLTCHRIEQQGASTGPTLNGIGARRSADEIRAAIINPPNPGNGTHSYATKITGEDLDSLVRYLALLPSE